MENEHYAFVLVVDQKYWDRLCDRTRAGKETHFFVRGSQVGPLSTNKLLFYVTKPKMQVLGTADFVERIVGDPQELWNQYGAQSIFDSPEEYQALAANHKQVTFIKFANFAEIPNPQPKEAVNSFLGSLSWFKPKYVNQKTAEALMTHGIG